MREALPSLAFSVGAVLLVAGFAIARWRAVRKAGDRYAAYRADRLAHTLGLTVVDGDPALNLMLAHHIHVQGSRARTHVTMRGTPYGRETSFVYDFVTDRQENPLLREAVYRNRFTCRLSVRGGAFPPFEVTLRRPNRMLDAVRELPLGPQPIGDQALDARFDLRSGDPRVGAALAPVLAAVTGYEVVHVLGYSGAVHWTAGENSSSVAIYHLPQVHRLLVDAVGRLEPLGPA